MCIYVMFLRFIGACCYEEFEDYEKGVEENEARKQRKS